MGSYYTYCFVICFFPILFFLWTMCNSLQNFPQFSLCISGSWAGKGEKRAICIWTLQKF